MIELKEREYEFKERELEAKEFEMELGLDEERKVRKAEREKYEAELQRERERVEADGNRQQLEFEERQHSDEMDRLDAQQAMRPTQAPRETSKAKTQKIPAFNEGKDEMDSYLLRFERYATAQRWEPDTWATGLSTLSQGMAQDVYALVPKEDAFDYNKLKRALLKRH